MIRCLTPSIITVTLLVTSLCSIIIPVTSQNEHTLKETYDAALFEISDTIRVRSEERV